MTRRQSFYRAAWLLYGLACLFPYLVGIYLILELKVDITYTVINILGMTLVLILLGAMLIEVFARRLITVEVWEADELIGGLYGVLLNRVFFAESMFSKQTDGSKMALAKLVERAREEGWKLIDCQFHTGHLESLGAREISRSKFLAAIG